MKQEQENIQNDFIAFEQVKHRNRKEIIGLQDSIEEKKFKRKVDFTKFLYDLKSDFLTKEEKAKLLRIKISKNLK